VHQKVADKFAELFIEKAKKIRQGDPRIDETQIGPQIHLDHFTRIAGFVERAKKEGANVVLGGQPNKELGGLFYQPTLVMNPKKNSEIFREEVFGPVLCLQTFLTDDEVIDLANDTDFGLAAVVVSGNREHASKITKNIVAGTIWVNCFFVRDLRAPFGGSKKSGIGRDGGTWSFDFYADVKNTVIAPNGWKE
jgi:5-carboxymethyl-2-hydroxymuconic-semialdehyde dehydrogenase